MERKYGFFFGAGAEACFGMPLGADYTRQTMCQKYPALYKALNSFYKNRLNADYAKEYREEFMFAPTSNTFFKIMYRAARDCSGDNNLDPSSRKVVDALFDEAISEDELKIARSKFRESYSGAYSCIVSDKCRKNDEEAYRSIVRNLSYYGSVEKDSRV